jgi:hypothetical protein
MKINNAIESPMNSMLCLFVDVINLIEHKNTKDVLFLNPDERCGSDPKARDLVQ